MPGSIVSVNLAPKKGVGKLPVSAGTLVAGNGLQGDAHAGGPRQVSLLAQEAIDSCAAKGVELKPGDFGENITTLGVDLDSLNIGERLLVGSEIVLQISEIGKGCATLLWPAYLAG